MFDNLYVTSSKLCTSCNIHVLHLVDLFFRLVLTWVSRGSSSLHARTKVHTYMSSTTYDKNKIIESLSEQTIVTCYVLYQMIHENFMATIKMVYYVNS